MFCDNADQPENLVANGLLVKRNGRFATKPPRRRRWRLTKDQFEPGHHGPDAGQRPLVGMGQNPELA
jgi:hypothetical protein